MAVPPVAVGDLPRIVRERPDFVAEFGGDPPEELLVFPCYVRVPMGLGHAVRVILAINQKHIHIALYGSAAWLSRLYPRPVFVVAVAQEAVVGACLLYTSPSPRDKRQSRMPSSA